MGCDIHFYVEVLDEGGLWIHHNWREDCYNRDEDGRIIYYQDEEEDGIRVWPSMDYDKYFKHPLYVGRNYDLFAILANVRNGYGFAGCDTGDGFNPISEPRGLPYDVSPEIREESDYYGIDGHSHTWFTIQELLDYDWDQVAILRGVVTVEQAEEYRRSGKKPETYCGWTNAPGHEQIEWEEKYRDCVSHFYNSILSELKKLGDPDKVRIVFWFDN